MIKRFLTMFLIAGFGIARPGSPAGEEFMPAQPGAYSEIGPEDSSQVRRTAPGQRLAMPARRVSHQNPVRLKLPSLGPPVESRMQMLEVAESSPGGSLNFSEARPAAPDSFIGIPGMVSPEQLALDMYNRRDSGVPAELLAQQPAPLEPLEPLIPLSPAPPDIMAMMPPAPLQPIHAAPELGIEAVQAMQPAGPDEPSMRRLDSIHNAKRPRTSYSRIEIPANATTVVRIPSPSTAVTTVSLPAAPAEPFRFEPGAVELPPPLRAHSSGAMPPVEVWDLDP